MSKRILLAAGLAVAMVVSAFLLPGTHPAADAAGSCHAISVVWDTTQVPAGTAPSFSFSGAASMQSTSFSPSIPGSYTITNVPGSGALPAGSYTITAASAAGTSQLTGINGGTGNSLTLNCGDQNSILFVLSYKPVATGSSGPMLRITPNTGTVQAGGNPISLHAQYSATGNDPWNDVTQAAQWSSGNGQILLFDGTGHLSADFYGVQTGTAQVIATYSGLTATANISVSAAGTPPAVSLGNCAGIVVESNIPTNWTITGPGGVQVQSPNYPQFTTGATVTQQAGGGAFPGGSYTITVPATVPGGVSPIITAGGFGTLGTTSGSLDCPGIYLHFGVRYAGTNPGQGAALQYVKTVLNMPAFKNDAVQSIVAGAWVGNHFVIRGGGCSINMTGNNASFQSGGGGLWSITETGSAIQERQMCLDAGAASNVIYHHGEDDGIMTVDGPNDFTFTNSTWAACVSGLMSGGTCAVNGPGATKTVHYTFQNGQVVVKSSEEPTANGAIPSSDGSTVRTTATVGDYTLTAAPKQGGGGSVIVTKGGQQVQNLVLPSGGNPVLIVASPNGYVAIGAASTDANSQSAGAAAVYLYKIGGATGGGQCTDLSTCGGNGGGGGVGDLTGSSFSISYSATSSQALVLIKFGSVVSASGTNLALTIFGRPYTVDASTGRIVTYGWAPTTLDEFLKNGYVNVYGTLDASDSTLIHAITVRDPIPTNSTAPTKSFTGTGTASDAVTTGGTTNASVQTKLDALQQALKALQDRLAH